MRSPQLGRTVQPLSREGPEKMPPFVWQHGPSFVLVAVLVAQLLLLSFQTNRNHHMRLIEVWTIAILRPFPYSVAGGVGSTTRAWSTCWHLRSAQKDSRQ